MLGTTIAIEVPKHNQLDRDGKSLEVINGLVSNNIPRVICWTLASVTLVYMVVQTFQA